MLENECENILEKINHVFESCKCIKESKVNTKDEKGNRYTVSYTTVDNRRDTHVIYSVEDAEDMVISEEMLCKLNDKVKRYQEKSLIKVIVRYMLATGNHDEIRDWGYEWVNVGLTRDRIKELRGIWGLIEETIDYEYYKGGIVEIVNDCESTVLHRAIGVKFKGGGVIEELQRNKICRRDLIRYLSKKLSTDGIAGIDKIKTVTSIQDIGYIMILNWEINYDTLEIEVKIEGDKILNVEEGEFIVESKIIEVFRGILGIGSALKVKMVKGN